MKQAKQDIVEIPYKDSLYLVSIVEKQNDSGIMFNDRIFFLQPGKCIGYISEVKIDESASKVSFDKPKLTVPISQLKTFVVNERELRIKVTQTDGTRRLEKDWNLRLATPLLAKKWYDRLQREKVLETVKKSSPKLEKNIAEEMRAKVEQSKTSPPRKSMQIIRSESFSFNVKPGIERVETGVGVTPAQSQSSLKRNILQTRQVGTIMSQKAESLTSFQHRESPQKRQPSKKQLALIQAQQANRQPQKSIVTNKIMQREPENQGVTDRSFAEPIINKSVRSEPVNRNIESFKLNRKDEKSATRPQQANVINNEDRSGKDQNASIRQVEHRLEQSGPDMIRLEHEIKSKDNINRSEGLSRKTAEKQPTIPENKPSQPQQQIKQERLNSSGIRSIKSLKKQEGERLAKEQLLYSQTQQVTALNNKKYITSEEFQKLNTSSPLNYFDRTSHLIKGSSHNEQLPEHFIHSRPQSQQSPKREEIVKSPSNKKLQEGKPPTPRESSNLKFSILEVKEEYQQCNESQQLHQIIQDEYSSIIVQEEKSEPLKELTWTFRYLQFGEAVFGEFKDFSQQLMQQLIEDLKLPAQQQLFKKRQVRNSIITYHIDDVQAKIAVIDIEEVSSEAEAKFKEKVCNCRAVKALKNEFSNYRLLYEHLEPAGRLKVPLVCLCEVNGFVALFKVLSKSLEKQVRMRDIEGEIEELKSRTRINNNFYHNHSRNIIQLDSQFYRSIDKNAKHSFDCFFLQEIEDYLLPDCLSDHNQHNLNLLRKQLILTQAEDPAAYESAARNKPISKLLERTVKEAEKISKQLGKAVSQVIAEIDSLNVYFFSSSQLGDYLHGKGVNVRYLGHICEHVSTAFQKRVLMSEIAARSCKWLFRKMLQDILLEEEALTSQSVLLKSCDFLNCVTSNSFETAAIWKVLSSHAVAYFGVELDFNCIEKGYFLLALVENCRLQVLWDKLHPLDVFKHTMLFTEKNLLGLLPLAQTYLPLHNSNYALCASILQQPHSEDGLSQLLSLVKSSDWASQFPSLLGQVRQYVSLFVSPYRAKEQQLGLALYESSEQVQPCRGYFELLLMEIKWYLKYKDRQQYIQKCDQFIRVATKYFGEFHPIFSELYDLFSSYHLSSLEFEDAITFAKSSLVNILKVCGTAHDKTSECYYNLALCYIKAGKKEEAFAHMKKAQLIFENSGRCGSVPCAIISLKLALIYLNQDQPELCLAAAVASLQILEGESLSCYEDELVDCYEMIARCYEILQEKAKIQLLADRCEAQLAAIASPHNLERALKIIIYPILSEASPENASVYLDIISQLSLEPNSQQHALAAERLKLRTKEGSLVRNLQEYLASMQEIEAFLRESDLRAGWQSFKESFPRETVSDFLALTEELLVFLGEGFVSGSLREAL